MRLLKAINILGYHNKWRKGEIDKMSCTPKEIGESIDAVLKAVKDVDISKLRAVSIYAESIYKIHKIDFENKLVECSVFLATQDDESMEIEVRSFNELKFEMT